MRSLNDALHAGAARAGAELGISAEYLHPEIFGVALSYALAERLHGGEPSRSCAEAELRALRQVAEQSAHPLAASWLYEPHTATRIVDIALDTFSSVPLAPPLRLLPAPHAVAEPLHALVFSAFPHITHELYPLMVDACVAAPALRVVGVHVDWLHKGRVTRAITYDVERDLLVEAPLAETVVPTTAQVLGLNLCHEHADHRRIAAELPGTRLLNPPAGAALLDDKARTAACWQRVNLDTPAFAAYPADLVAFVAENGSRIVIKPGDGTEGRAVGIFDLHQPVQRAAAFRHLDELGANALVTVERGTVRACTDKGPVRCVIRINVCWDGARAWAESGYAQLAGSQGIASAGRGGRVIALSDLWRRLCREDGTPLTPSPGDWRCLLATAENGTRALAGELDGTMPALIGLDLLLDVANNDSLLPILLEANPRPSGMARCTLLTANTPTGDPGIAPHLWPCIVARLA